MEFERPRGGKRHGQHCERVREQRERFGIPGGRGESVCGGIKACIRGGGGFQRGRRVRSRDREFRRQHRDDAAGGGDRWVRRRGGESVCSGIETCFPFGGGFQCGLRAGPSHV